MANIQTKANLESPEQTSSDNLVMLEEKNSHKNPNELNAKIGSIDKGLDDLKQELTTINQSMSESLERLSDNDTDLTSKVSATYKQLGNLEESYSSLNEKSSHIKQDIDVVSQALAELSEQSDTDIQRLTEGYDGLIEKTHELVKKSKKTARTLNKSIKDNASAMKLLEQKLGDEIETLAASSKSRSDSLEEDIKSQQARLLKLQEVDKALEVRTHSLEAASQDLHKKSKELSKSHNLLNRRADTLADDIAALQQKTEEHSGMIGGLQENVIKLSEYLLDMHALNKKRFIGVVSSLALLVIALAAFFMYEQTNWNAAEQNNVVIDNNIQTINNHLNGIDSRMQEMNDSLDSLDGRVASQSPLRQFGGDNIIHGPQWLAQINEPFIIQLTVVPNKQAMYEIADRYSFYLKEKLSYLTIAEGQYVMFYGGFKNQQEAQVALSDLPYHIQSDTPAIYRTIDVQAQIVSVR